MLSWSMQFSVEQTNDPARSGDWSKCRNNSVSVVIPNDPVPATMEQEVVITTATHSNPQFNTRCQPGSQSLPDVASGGAAGRALHTAAKNLSSWHNFNSATIYCSSGGIVFFSLKFGKNTPNKARKVPLLEAKILSGQLLEFSSRDYVQRWITYLVSFQTDDVLLILIMQACFVFSTAWRQHDDASFRCGVAATLAVVRSRPQPRRPRHQTTSLKVTRARQRRIAGARYRRWRHWRRKPANMADVDESRLSSKN